MILWYNLLNSFSRESFESDDADGQKKRQRVTMSQRQTERDSPHTGPVVLSEAGTDAFVESPVLSDQDKFIHLYFTSKAYLGPA